MMRVICVAIIFLSSQLSFLSYPTTIRSYRLVKQNIKQQQLYQTSQTYSDDNILTIANDNISTATISGLIYTNEGISSSSSASSIVKFLRKLTYFKVCPLSDKEKQGLFEDFSSMANTLSFQDISNCIWNLGLIGFKINILSNHSSVTPVIAAIRLSVESLEEEEEVDELRPQPILPPSHSLLRLVGGLEKIGIPWIDFPPALRQRYLGTLNTKMTDEALGREVATLIWTLGRLGALLSELPQDDQVTLWRRIYLVTLSSSLTPQGLAMMTNGLAKLGARWDLIEENIRSRLALKIAECDLNAGETCSVITALASMGVSVFPRSW